jgi:sulfonate transport system ATP-binding protein
MSVHKIKNGVQVAIRGIRKSFSQAEVLNDIQLHLKPGEFVAVVGRSGCGKSTLLRLIAGLEKPTGGVILIDNLSVAGIHPQTRVLFQDSRLLPWMRVLDNVRIGAPGGDKALALEALRQVGLEHRANDWPAVLSGGQRQRVALARALVGNPGLLLLDEPLGALDALTRLEMQGLIERLWKEKQFTAVLVTHDVSEAVTLADRVVAIENGRIGLDVKIALSRPRERDSGFSHYERIILDRLLVKEPQPYAVSEDATFSI